MGDTTTSAFASPPDITGGFRVDNGRYRHLDQQAKRLGFASCAAPCRPCRTTVGVSPSSPPTSAPPNRPSAAPSLTTRTTSHPAASSSPASASAAQQRATARIAELGVAGMRAYLVDRLVSRASTLAEVASELGAAPSTLRRLLDQHKVRRVAAPTRRQHSAAAAAREPQKQARSVQQRRQARLAELGFAALEEYLRDRYIGRGWSVRRLCAELGVGHGWLDQQLARLGRRSSAFRSDGGRVGGSYRSRVTLSTITIFESSIRRRCSPGGRAPLTSHVGTRHQ